MPKLYTILAFLSAVGLKAVVVVVWAMGRGNLHWRGIILIWIIVGRPTVLAVGGPTVLAAGMYRAFWTFLLVTIITILSHFFGD